MPSGKECLGLHTSAHGTTSDSRSPGQTNGSQLLAKHTVKWGCGWGGGGGFPIRCEGFDCTPPLQCDVLRRSRAASGQWEGLRGGLKTLAQFQWLLLGVWRDSNQESYRVHPPRSWNHVLVLVWVRR